MSDSREPTVFQGFDALIAKWRYVASREALSSYVVWQMCADELENLVRELVPVPPAPQPCKFIDGRCIICHEPESGMCNRPDEPVSVPPAPSGELAAIRALCAEAGMSEQSTTLDYIRSAFYQLGKCQREAQVAAPAPSAPPAYTIEIEQEDDGRYFASWTTGDGKEAGTAEYSTTVVGALAELCATLLKVDEDKSKCA